MEANASHGLLVSKENVSQAGETVNGFSEKDKNKLFSLKDAAEETMEDSYVKYALKDGDGRSEEEIRQEYREDISPLMETDEAEEWDVWTQHREGKKRNERAAALDGLQEQLVRQFEAGEGTRYSGNISDVSRKLLTDTGSGISTARANKILRTAYAHLDEALNSRATGKAMQEAVDAAFETARQAAEESLQNLKAQYLEESDEDAFLQQLRYTPFSLSKDQMSEVRNAYESVAAYRQAAFGNLRVVSKETSRSQLEDMWEEIAAKTGLDEDTNAADMPLALLEYIEDRRNARKKVTALTDEENAIADIVAQDALMAYYASRKRVNEAKSAKQLAWENRRLKDKIETLKQKSETALREERGRIDAQIERQTAELNRALTEEKQFSRSAAKRVDELAVKIHEERKKHEAELKKLKKELEKERRRREAEKQKRDAVKREKEQKSADLIREEYEGTLAPMLQGEQEATGKWTKAMQQAANERRRDNALTMAAIEDLETAQERSVRQAAEAINSRKSGEHVSRYTGNVTELARNIRAFIGGDGMTEKQLVSKIKGVFAGLEESKRTGETKTALHEAMRTLSDVMRDQMADRDTGDDAVYQRVKDTLRAERFYLTKEQEESVRDIFRSTAVFRKQGYGVLSMGTEKTAKQTLTEVWGKLTAIDAEAFPADTKASDMPDVLMSYLNERRGQGAELSGEYMTLANSAALAALTDYYQNQSAEYSGKDADLLAKQVERLQAAMQKNADKYKQAKKKEKAEREKTKNRQGIRKLARELRTAIASPTESRYVPVNYMRTILDVTEALTNGDKQVLDKALTKWRNANTQMQNDSDYFVKQAFDKDMEKRIAEMVELTERKSVEQLDGEETRFVYETLRGAATALQNARKIIGKGKKKDAFEAASEGIRQLRNTKGSDAHGLIKQFGNRYLTMMQSGVRFFRLISGYAKDGVLEERAQALNEGQHKANKIKMEGSGIFADLIAGKDLPAGRQGRQTDRALQKELASFTGRNAEWVDTGVEVAVERNGQITKEKLTMTRAMRASLYMHSKNEQNMNHVTKGGITIPDARLYREGKLQEAYARGVTVRLTEKEVGAVIRGMTEYEKQWCEGWTKLEEKLSREINDTSLKLNGFKKAVVDNYFPIRTDRNFVRSNFETVVNDASLEGMGMLKSRVNGSNPILLEDITKVAERQIDNTAKYAGLAIPVRDFMTVYNATMPGYAGSMKQEVAQKWGAVGQKYIENLMADLQGARQGENSFLDRARGKFAQAKLNMNISTAFKQVSGAMVITPYTGWAAMTKAMGTGSRHMKSTDFIAQWTATNWARGDNRAKTEIGGVARDFTLFDRAPRLDWLNRMDEWTMRKIWTACEYAVNEQSGQDGTAYKQGTKAYTDYYTQVAALFDQCVDDTQPSSGVMQRTDIARDPNQLTKSLTMFMGQGLQNFGVLTDTWGEMRARAADVKANASAENQAAFKAAKTRFASAVASQLTAAAVTAISGLLARMLLARMNPYRDDKEEITGESLMEGIIDDTLANIAGTVIGGQEAYNLLTAVMQGKTPYDIEAAGVSTLNELYQSGAKFLTAVSSALSGDKTPEQRVEKVKSAGWTLGKTVAEWFGIPATNLENIVTGAVSNMQDLINGELLSYNAGMKDLTLTKGARYMADALNVGDLAEYTRLMNRLRKQGKTDAQIMTALKKEYRDNDKRVLAAAEALNAGDLDTYESMAGELTGLGFASSTVREMVTAAAEALQKAEEKEDGTEEAVPYAAYLPAGLPVGQTGRQAAEAEALYTTAMLNNLLESGETQAAQRVRKALIRANGQKQVDSAIQKKFKPLIVEAWENGDTAEYSRLKNILKQAGFTEQTISGWVRGTKSSSYKGWSGGYRGYSSGYRGYSSSYKGWSR